MVKVKELVKRFIQNIHFTQQESLPKEFKDLIRDRRY